MQRKKKSKPNRKRENSKSITQPQHTKSVESFSKNSKKFRAEFENEKRQKIGNEKNYDMALENMLATRTMTAETYFKNSLESLISTKTQESSKNQTEKPTLGEQAQALYKIIKKPRKSDIARQRRKTTIQHQRESKKQKINHQYAKTPEITTSDTRANTRALYNALLDSQRRKNQAKEQKTPITNSETQGNKEPLKKPTQESKESTLETTESPTILKKSKKEKPSLESPKPPIKKIPTKIPKKDKKKNLRQPRKSNYALAQEIKQKKTPWHKKRRKQLEKQEQKNKKGQNLKQKQKNPPKKNTKKRTQIPMVSLMLV